MTSRLDDLFDQIINSERLAYERKSRLNDIRHNVAEAEKQILEQQNLRKSLQQQLSSKIEKLNEEKMNLKWLQRREQILLEQKKTLEQEHEQYLYKMQHSTEQMTKKKEEFCSQVETFLSDYGLRGCGPSQRKQAAEIKLEELNKEEKILHKDAEQYEMHKSAIDLLQTQEKDLREEFEKHVQKNAEKAQELEDERNSLSEKECELETVKKFTFTNPEYIRLHKELDDSKSDNLEEKCQDLQQKVQRLQQQLWQKTMRKRQQQNKQQDNSLKPKQPVNTDVTKKIPTSNRVCVSNFKMHGHLESCDLKISVQTKENLKGNVDSENFDDIFEDDFV